MSDKKEINGSTLDVIPNNDDLNKKIGVPDNWLDLILSKNWWMFATAFMLALALAMGIFYWLLGSLRNDIEGLCSDIKGLRFELPQDINRQIDLLREK